jgi:hypothetical protein
MKNKGSKSNDYQIYLRVREDDSGVLPNEYEDNFVELLNSFCSFESQSGLCSDLSSDPCSNSLYQSDRGYELFSVDVKSFKEAKNIALKCSLLWKIGVVCLIVNDHSVCIKYTEPTLVSEEIPDLPVFNKTYHFNICNGKQMIYKIITYDLSSIDHMDDFMAIKTKK